MHYYLVYEWNSHLIKLIIPVMNAELNLTPIFTQDLWSSAVVTIWFSVTSLTKAISPQTAHFVGSGKSPGHSKVLYVIFQICVSIRSSFWHLGKVVLTFKCRQLLEVIKRNRSDRMRSVSYTVAFFISLIFFHSISQRCKTIIKML